jgi:mRNA interferase MazF
MVDLGLAAKARPCLLLTGYPADDELAMITVLSHTTAVRGSRWEHTCPKPFLKPGAFHLQLIHSVPIVKLMRKPGELNPAELITIRNKLQSRLQI